MDIEWNFKLMIHSLDTSSVDTSNNRSKFRQLLLHFNISIFVRFYESCRVPRTLFISYSKGCFQHKKKMVDSPTAISCANKSWSKVHQLSYLCAQFERHSMSATQSVFLWEKTHACVCRLTSKHIHFFHACISKRKVLLFPTISSFVVSIAAAVVHSTLSVCMGSRFLS